MKEGPDIALIGSLIGDPARANILIALMTGKALTATELAAESGITIQTASSHLKKLENGQLLRRRKQGRHQYFTLADDDVGGLLESMMGLAAKRGLIRTRTGPNDDRLRKARVCYNHLAGEFGVHLYDVMKVNGHIIEADDSLMLTTSGHGFITEMGIDLDQISKGRRPLCKSCLDWSSRRSHLAGSLGTALLQFIYEKGWAKRKEGSRAVVFSTIGEREFLSTFSKQKLQI